MIHNETFKIEFVGYVLGRNRYRFECPYCHLTVKVAFAPDSTKMWNHACGSRIIYIQDGTRLKETLVMEVARG
jgi:hypothetical protein